MVVRHGVNFRYRLERRKYERSHAAEGGCRARPHPYPPPSRLIRVAFSDTTLTLVLFSLSHRERG
jgi:hypothetical protein